MELQNTRAGDFEFCESLSVHLPVSLQVDDPQKLPRTSWPAPTNAPLSIFLCAGDLELSDGDFHAALRAAVERATNSRWRIVCPHILTERGGQSRTLVLKGAVLRALLRRLCEHQLSPLHSQVWAGSTPDGTLPVAPPISAELHGPLSGRPVQHATIFIH